MRKLLEEYRTGAEAGIQPWERQSYGEDRMTAGVGLYYFEEA